MILKRQKLQFLQECICDILFLSSLQSPFAIHILNTDIQVWSDQSCSLISDTMFALLAVLLL